MQKKQRRQRHAYETATRRYEVDDRVDYAPVYTSRYWVFLGNRKSAELTIYITDCDGDFYGWSIHHTRTPLYHGTAPKFHEAEAAVNASLAGLGEPEFQALRAWADQH